MRCEPALGCEGERHLRVAIQAAYGKPVTQAGTTTMSDRVGLWDVLTNWEFKTKDKPHLESKLTGFLGARTV